MLTSKNHPVALHPSELDGLHKKERLRELYRREPVGTDPADLAVPSASSSGSTATRRWAF
jgi:hypothetical protein